MEDMEVDNVVELQEDVIYEKNTYVFKPLKFELLQIHPDCAYIPAPRGAHRVVCTSKNLYVFGGYNPSMQPSLAVNDLWRFNFASRKWTVRAQDDSLPTTVVSAAVARKKETLLIYGGTGVPFGYRSSNKLHSINLKENGARFHTFETVGETPQAMYGQAVVLHGNVLYAVGGTDGFEYSCDVHRMNLSKSKKVWRRIYETLVDSTTNGLYHPAGRYRHELGFDRENIYVLGGGTSVSSFSLTYIPAFNIASQRWQRCLSKADPNSEIRYPNARKCHAVVQLNTEKNRHYLYVTGGVQDVHGVFNDLWKLELPTLQWTLLSASVLPHARYFQSAGVTREGKMYIFGGIEHRQMRLHRHNDVYAGWLIIPKLSEIAWEAVLHYIRPNVDINKETVIKLNLPKRFLHRLE